MDFWRMSAYQISSFRYLNMKMQIHWIISQALKNSYLYQMIKSRLIKCLHIAWNKTFFGYILLIMSDLYTDSHKRYSKKIFSQTTNPMRRNSKHGIAQHIWNYAYVVTVHLHCNIDAYIYNIHKPDIIYIYNQMDICRAHRF